MRIDNYAYASPSPLYGAVDFMEPEDAEEVSSWVFTQGASEGSVQ